MSECRDQPAVHPLAKDEEQERTVGLMLSAKEPSWRTVSTVRSLLRWTTTSSHDAAPRRDRDARLR